jgi:hypothetical protein
MMVLSVLRPDASLPEFLAHRARSAGRLRLALDVALGIAGTSAVLYWKPTASLILASAALCFFAYGSWGLVDRAHSYALPKGKRIVTSFLEIICVFLAALGSVAAAGILFGVWAAAIGTWIS